MLVKSDFAAMAAYWLFGPLAIGQPVSGWRGLTPAPTNWAPTTGDFQKPEPGVKDSQLAAYCWYRVQCTRATVKQPLDLPPFSKLVGIVATLRKRMTQDELVSHVDCIAKNWPAIVAALSWMGSPPPLDATVLNHPKVKELTDRLGRGESIARVAGAAPTVAVSVASLDLAAQIAKRKNVVSL